MNQIVNRFSFHNKDEHRKPVSVEHWQTLKTSTGSLVIQMEKFEDLIKGEQREPITDKEIEESGARELLISDMTKGEFRDYIRYQVAHLNLHGNGGVDIDLVNQAVQKANRIMRRELGGLQYNAENAKIAIEQYKKLM